MAINTVKKKESVSSKSDVCGDVLRTSTPSHLVGVWSLLTNSAVTS